MVLVVLVIMMCKTQQKELTPQISKRIESNQSNWQKLTKKKDAKNQLLYHSRCNEKELFPNADTDATADTLDSQW